MFVEFLAFSDWCGSNPVNIQRVVRYLKSHGVKKGLLYTPEHTHGQAFLPGSDELNQIMDWLEGCQ